MGDVIRDYLKATWRGHGPLKLGSPSPHFVMKRGHLARFLQGLNAGAILDIACDQGYYGYLAAETISAVRVLDGFDLNGDAVAVARGLESRARRGLRCRHWVGDIDTEVLGTTYDLVLYVDALVYASDPERMLREAHAHTSPGGHLILYSPVSDGVVPRMPGWARARLPDWSQTCSSLRSRDVVRFVDASGYRVVAVEWAGRHPYRLFRMWEYWVRSYSVLASYGLAPLGWILAAADSVAPGKGSGVFVLAEA